MTTTKSANGKNGYPLAMLIRESAHDIWLAGLGAYARAGKEGGRLFDSLVDLGESVERKAREEVSRPIRAAERGVEGARNAASELLEHIELLIERRIAKTLHALQIPTHRDVAELAQRVEQLNKTVRQLTRERDAARKKAPRPAATRKKPTRRTARTGAQRKKASSTARPKRSTTARRA